MAMDAEAVHFFPIPFSGSLAMDSCLPVPEYGAVTLPAEIIRFFKRDELAVCQPQFVSVIRVMAVKTPALLSGMGKTLGYFGMLIQFSPGGVRVHVGVAFGTGKNIF